MSPLPFVIFAIQFCLGSLEHPEIPIIKHMYTADPSAHSWDDETLYLYPSHDIAPPVGCDLMDKYHVFSTKDMINWVDHGQIIEAAEVPWGLPTGGFMWAPDAAYKDGKYYFYFPHPTTSDRASSWEIGIMVSDQPHTDFKLVGYIPDYEKLGGTHHVFDPCVFVDDDGTPYLYVGGSKICRGGKMKNNMLELDGPMTLFSDVDFNDQLPDFHEGPFVFKRNGTYYMMYPDNVNPSNQMRYATSNSPLGPWNYRGIFLGSTGSDTTHGSIVQFKGKWYIFFHNVALSGKGNMRSVCCAEITFNADGTINRFDPEVVRRVDLPPGPTTDRPEITEGGGEFFVKDYGRIGELVVIKYAEALGGAFCSFNQDGAWATFSGIDLPPGQYFLYLRYSGANGHVYAEVNGQKLDSAFMMIANNQNDDFSAYTDPQLVALDGGGTQSVTVRLSGAKDSGAVNVVSLIFVPFANSY